jgi:hypothetical protein
LGRHLLDWTLVAADGRRVLIGSEMVTDAHEYASLPGTKNARSCRRPSCPDHAERYSHLRRLGLAELARRPGRVTEEPEAHLVPHLRDANIARLQLVECQTGEGGVLAVSTTYHPDASRREAACLGAARDDSRADGLRGAFAQAHLLAGTEFVAVLSSSIPSCRCG